MSACLLGAASEDFARDGEVLAEGGGEIVLEPARKMEDRLFRKLAARRDDTRITAPANFDPAEKIGLRPGHAEDPTCVEFRMLSEDLWVRMEFDLGAAPVMDVTQFLQAALGNAARETLPVEFPVAGDLHLKKVGQGVDDGHANTVQTAGGFVSLAVEFAAGVKLGHDHFERRLARHLRMVLDRYAATIVGDGQAAFDIEMHLDEIGMAGHGLVHRIVDDFGKEMVKCLFIRAADIHAGTHADRLEPFQNPDRRGAVFVCNRRRGRRGCRRSLRLGHGNGLRHVRCGRHIAEEVVLVIHRLGR